MNTNRTAKSSLEVSLPKHQSQYVREHSRCAMCESELEISHEINTKELKVKEEAYCPQCALLVRRSQHLMH